MRKTTLNQLTKTKGKLPSFGTGGFRGLNKKNNKH